MEAAALLKITKLALSAQRFDQSLQNFIWWCKMVLLTTPTIKKFEFQKSKTADDRHVENR